MGFKYTVRLQLLAKHHNRQKKMKKKARKINNNEKIGKE